MTDPTTPEGRAELRDLLRRTAPRPWSAQPGINGRDDVTCRWPGGPVEVVAQVSRVRLDAELIIAARNALPELLDALDRAEDYTKANQQIVDQCVAALDRVRAVVADWTPARGSAAVFVDEVCTALDGDQ